MPLTLEDLTTTPAHNADCWHHATDGTNYLVWPADDDARARVLIYNDAETQGAGIDADKARQRLLANQQLIKVATLNSPLIPMSQANLKREFSTNVACRCPHRAVPLRADLIITRL